MLKPATAGPPTGGLQERLTLPSPAAAVRPEGGSGPLDAALRNWLGVRASSETRISSNSALTAWPPERPAMSQLAARGMPALVVAVWVGLSTPSMNHFHWKSVPVPSQVRTMAMWCHSPRESGFPEL